jgi:hypothetical protein
MTPKPSPLSLSVEAVEKEVLIAANNDRWAIRRAYGLLLPD